MTAEDEDHNRITTLHGWLTRWLADRIGSSSDVDAHRPLQDYGLGSRDLVGLTGELGDVLGRDLDPEIIFRFPTIAALAEFLAADFDGAPAAEPVAVSDPPARAAEPIAVIGIGCRFPGRANGPDGYWRLLTEGRSGVVRLADGRWDRFRSHDPALRDLLDGAAGWGGFLDDVAGFDAAFFGITPHEADAMDPQQRVTAEVTWEALDHAGIPAGTLHGSATGVFIGASTADYGADQLSSLDERSATGSSMGVIASRLSYLLGTRGPSLVVDTACSASLTAIHLACQSLRGRECDLALAGGVSLLLSPAVSVAFQKAGVLAPDGRSKTFDEDADGYGRGEGAGVVVLKRLSDAQRDGDRVLAVVLGSATNQDGRSNGLMAPQPGAQEELLRSAYDRAGVDPREVGFVETHGTGTSLGDPVEVSAIDAVLCDGRDMARPLLLGAVKSSLGHLEAAAGVAGFIKTALVLRHGKIPANLNFRRPNPLLHLDRRPIRPVARPQDWPSAATRRLAGVSAFGFGGANAHAVLAQAPDVPDVPGEPGPAPDLILVSGSTAEGMRREAAKLADWLSSLSRPPALSDLAHTTTARRAHGQVRGAVVAHTLDELRGGLRALSLDEHGDNVVRGRVRDDPGPVFVFSGQGSQYVGMARELLKDVPGFAETIDAVDAVVQAELGFSVRAVLLSDDPAALQDVDVVQPVLFAVQVGLSTAMAAHGVRPAAVIGHSMGEAAAAVTAGVLDLADGARLTCRRARLLASIAGAGAMAVVTAPAADVAEAITGAALAEAVNVAVIAGPSNTVISGTTAAVAALGATFAADGVDVMPIDVAVASHSPQVDPILDEVRAQLSDLRVNEPRTPLYSTVIDPVETPWMNAGYWAANLRRPVNLERAVATAARNGHSVFVEISPHPVLTRPTRQILGALDVPDPMVLPTLRRDQQDMESLTIVMANIACVTRDPATTRRPAARGRLVDLPSRQWHHRRHWLESGSAELRPAANVGHPLLGSRTDPADRHDVTIWQRRLQVDEVTWLGAHRVGGVRLAPASVCVELVLAAAREVGFTDATVQSVRLLAPIEIGDEPFALQTVCRRDAGEAGATVQIFRRPAEDQPWTAVASARLERGQDDGSEPVVPRPALIAPDNRSVAQWYADLEQAGAGFGPQLRAVTSLSGTGSRMEATLALPPGSADNDAYVLHPVLLAAGLQVASTSWAEATGSLHGDEASPAVIAGFGEVRLTGVGPVTGVVSIATETDDRWTATAYFMAGDRVAAVVSRIRFAHSPGPSRTMTAPTVPAEWLHELRWEPGTPPMGPAEKRPAWLIVGHDDLGLADEARRHDIRTRAIAADPTEEELDAALRAGIDADLPFTRVIYLGARGDAGSAASVAVDCVRQVLGLTRHLLVLGTPGPRLVLATRFGQHTGAESPEQAVRVDPAQAALWGLGRTIALEHPRVWHCLVDLDDSPAAGAHLRIEAAAEDAGQQAAWRAGTRYVPRLVPVPRTTRQAAPVSVGDVRSVAQTCHLVVGANGRLGPHLLRSLAARGIRHIVSVSRRGLRGEAATAAARLETAGVGVTDVALDVADEAGMTALFDRFGDDLPALSGIHHLAFVQSTAPVTELTDEQINDVFRAKVAGADLLDRLSDRQPVTEFVVLSTTSGLLGAGQLGHYAAASTCADALITRRVAAGRPVTLVRLGPCADGLEGTDEGRSIRDAGWRLMPGHVAVAALSTPVAAGVSGVVADADWSVLNETIATATATPLLRPSREFRVVPGAIVRPRSAGGDAGTGPAEALSRVPSPQRPSVVRQRLAEIVAEVLGLDAADVSVHQSLFDLGVDSLMSLRLRRLLTERMNWQIPPTALRDHPTVSALADLYPLADDSLEPHRKA